MDALRSSVGFGSRLIELLLGVRRTMFWRCAGLGFCPRSEIGGGFVAPAEVASGVELLLLLLESETLGVCGRESGRGCDVADRVAPAMESWFSDSSSAFSVEVVLDGVCGGSWPLSGAPLGCNIPAGLCVKK